MAVTSIPKRKLINLILDELESAEWARKYFHIDAETNIENRLDSFTKGELLTYLASLGPKAEKALKSLSTSFPIRRPPTLYLAIIENKPNPDVLEIFLKANEKANEKMTFNDGEIIRSIFLPKSGVNKIDVDGLTVLEIQLQYEHRFDYVEANADADNYAELTYLYSLETAIIWIPIEKHFHAVIACSDYPVQKKIRDFLAIKLDLQIYPPTLSKGMLERITKGASPRSVTYTLTVSNEEMNEPQHITVSDPYLDRKPQFQVLIGNKDREQVSGFYTTHPGLSLGGIGVARRDGKIWTPRRLDHNEILRLARSIIEQAERELAKTDDFKVLANYLHLRRVTIGDKELVGRAKYLWVDLLPYIFLAQQDKSKETPINPGLLNKLITHQKDLDILTAAEYDCPNCGVTLLARCADCNDVLFLDYEDHIIAKCPTCKRTYYEELVCADCGQSIISGELTNYVRIVPNVDNLKSVLATANIIGAKYKGSWIIRGQSLKHVTPKSKKTFKQLSLQDFLLWKKQARLGFTKEQSFSETKTIAILNQTKEKCYRDGRAPKKDKCQVCVESPLNPDWLLSDRGMCLLRVFGVPISQLFEGIHHGHEFADILYDDIHIESGKKLRIGIHVKSRHRQPPNGMGRTSLAIKGLYTQTIYSAYEAAVNGKKIDVIGIAMPNNFGEDIVESLAYAVNSLGFSFLVIDVDEWKEIINIAYEQILFDHKSRVD